METAEELRAAMAEAVVGYAGPIVAAIRSASRVGSRALWSTVSDQVVWGVLRGARLGAGGERAAAEADLLLATVPPLSAARPRWFRHRQGAISVQCPVSAACCLAYKLPPHTDCPTTCPKVDDPARRRR